MELNDNVFTLIKNAISLNGAQLINEDDSYLCIDDKLANIFYIVVKELDNHLEEMIGNSIKYEPTVSVISEKRLPLNPVKQFKCFRETYQYSYSGHKFEINVPYQISALTIDDYDYLQSHYYRNGDDKEYLLGCINRGMLKAHYGNTIIGFVGEHPEHALGLLYVDEAYRRQGIGGTLERAMINKILDDGRIPIEHVVIDNEKSKKLQASIPDMVRDNGYVYWFF